MQQEQEEAKRSTKEPGEASFPLWCPSSALYWQKLNIVLNVKQNAYRVLAIMTEQAVKGEFGAKSQ